MPPLRHFIAAYCASLALAGIAHGDTLTLGSANGVAGAVVQLPFSFVNTHQIVGMQFDLSFPAALVDAGAAAAASASTDHGAESRELGPGTRRIVVYSKTNQLFPSDLVLNVPLSMKTGSPLGGPTVTISRIILTDALGRTFTPALNRPALDAWRLANFTETERNASGMIGDDRDPDGDGLPNLLEFLMGGNPKSKQAGYAPESSLYTDPLDGSRHLTLTFRKARTAEGGTLQVQGSPDLITWNTAGVSLTPTGVEDATSIEYVAVIPLAPGGRQFLRVLGARNPGP